MLNILKKIIILSLLAVMYVAFLLAKTRRITRKVIDKESFEGMIGVSVVQRGTSNGTITDTDGNYSIEVTNEFVTLIISFVEKKTVFATVNTSVIRVNVIMDFRPTHNT